MSQAEIGLSNPKSPSVKGFGYAEMIVDWGSEIWRRLIKHQLALEQFLSIYFVLIHILHDHLISQAYKWGYVRA